jgi:hypothetical protein
VFNVRPMAAFRSSSSTKVSAWRRNSSAIIGGLLRKLEMTVTWTPRRCTATSSEQQSPSPENSIMLSTWFAISSSLLKTLKLGVFVFSPVVLGGPGRPPGSRNRLAEIFLADLCSDWRKYGAAVVAKVRKEHPAVYLRTCPSSDNLRLIRLFEKGGSGSSGVRV